MKRIFVTCLSLAYLMNIGSNKAMAQPQEKNPHISTDDRTNWQPVELPSGYIDSHILSIKIRGDEILVGTYGRGALFGRDNGNTWVVYDTAKGLSWDFILGGDWDGDYMILATLGDGVNISTDGGSKWTRYGYNFFGIEYLYAVGALISNGQKYIPTADGLVVFGDSIKDWHSITEKNGIASQYLYDIALREDTIALGSLHGYSISYDRGKTWSNFSPNGKYDDNKLPLCKVRAVEFGSNELFAGCDDGLYMSSDNGTSWNRIGEKELLSQFIRDLVYDNFGGLWVATYKGVFHYLPKGQYWSIFGSNIDLPAGGVNCMAKMNGGLKNGGILAGTNYGLYRLTAVKPVQPASHVVDTTFDKTENPAHQWMLRPIGPDNQNCKDQTYLYGSTMGGNFRQHQGNEYNNPEGVPILAVDNGAIVFADTAIGHSVLKCDTRQDGQDIYAHYHHQNEILKKVGDRVNRGDTIGTIGKKGNVTNEHLHFEVALSPVGSQIDSVSHTRNSELWVVPLPACGTIVGTLVDSRKKPVPGARIYGVTKPVPTETPFSFAETYKEKVHPDAIYGENFVIGDVPAGDYILYANVAGAVSRIKAHVDAGKFTIVTMQLK